MTEHLKSECVRRFIESASTPGEQIAAKTADIYAAMLRESKHLDAGNFNAIHPDDLERMFRLYDEAFFEGQCKALLGETPLDFRLSKRMTRAAGKTSRFFDRDRSGNVLVENQQAEHFTDGKRYETYYIPLQHLAREVLQPPDETS